MTTAADYTEKIPNNVDLHEDRRLQRALESWQPNFLDWWESMGPTLPTEDVYLRTAVNVGREGWAHFGHVAMKDYRWGIFLAERDRDRQIGFGEHKGEPAWQKVPGEYRADLQRLIVIQGDTEPASRRAAAQPRRDRAVASTTCATCSRSTSRRAGTSGRWSTCCTPTSAARAARRPRSCCTATPAARTRPRILGAFNEETPDWLSFFMFTYFTDRDGKYQLGTLKESAFDPLSRTCEFMLKEEAHHMMVGTTGVDRVVRAHRAADDRARHRRRRRARRHPAGRDPEVPELPLLGLARPVRLARRRPTSRTTTPPGSRAAGWRSGARTTTSSPTTSIMVDAIVDGEIAADRGGRARRAQHRPAPRVHLRLPERRQPLEPDPRRGRSAAAAAPAARRVQPQGRRVRRHRGDARTGELLSADEWERRKGQWLPTDVDKTYVRSLMQPVHERGKIAAWIAPPRQGINGKPFDYDYVHLA